LPLCHFATFKKSGVKKAVKKWRQKTSLNYKNVFGTAATFEKSGVKKKAVKKWQINFLLDI
jgi:hypothetical protein